MGQALYRKYRPTTLKDVLGQEPTTRSLARALKAGQTSHAYLLTGPRGVGKTSIARILAHEINELPYEDERSHLDIIEIDAASNRRIDEIRDLRDRVHIAPTSAKYKVYIIDEVHMLTKEAFNALLKTLEEPPAHVIFILATTEVHKLPETIISRTQHFTFRPVAEDTIVAHLRTIATAEKITVDDAALELIARHGEGSFRDSIGLLDQARTSATHIRLEDIQTILGLAPSEGIDSSIQSVEAGNVAQLVQTLQQLREQGFEAAMIAKQLGQAWRSRLLHSETTLPHAVVLALLERLLQVPSSHDSFSLLEIVLLETAMAQQGQERPTTQATVAPSPNATETATAAVAAATIPSPEEQVLQKAVNQAKEPTPELWPEILNTIKKHHNTLYGIVRMATPEFSQNKLHLTFRFAFHQKQVSEARNKKIIAAVVQELTGKKMEITTAQSEQANAAVEAEATPKPPITIDDPAIITISNIFGSAELLESEN